MKYNKKIIGITGSIATGKSTVTEIIRKNGYQVIDADNIAHELMRKGKINYNNIVDYFGYSILDENDEIDRKKLGNIVFSDRKKLEDLNDLTHDNIFNKIVILIEKSDKDIIFLDIALLFESFKKYITDLGIDQIWLVYTTSDLQLKRLIKRNSLDKEEAKKRIDSQMGIDDKISKADVVLYNTKDVEFLKKQVIERLNNL